MGKALDIAIMKAIHIPTAGGRKVNVLGIPMCVITPAGFEGFFEEIGALSPHEQQDIPRVLEIGKKYGLEFPPPRNDAP